MKARDGVLLISLLAAPIVLGLGYEFFIGREFVHKCRTTPKLVIHDKAAFDELSRFVLRESTRLGSETWYSKLARIGFTLDHRASAFGWELGNTEVRMPIRKNGRLIAEVYNIVQNRPNWLGVIGVYGSEFDASCAHHFPQFYPVIWRKLVSG